MLLTRAPGEASLAEIVESPVMVATWRIRLGLLALVLAASCGRQRLNDDAGTLPPTGSAGTGVGVGGQSAGTGGCGSCPSSMLPVAARDIVYSPTRNQIFASVYGDADAYANTIVVIDPSTSSVVSSIPIGSNPRALALSSDGSTLWVAIDGAHSFRKVTLGSTPPVVGPLVRLPNAQPARYFSVDAMTTLPGAGAPLAIAMSDGYVTELRVYDDGVPRAAGIPNSYTVSALAAGPSGLIFGLDSSSRVLYVFRVDSTGIAKATPFFGLIRNYTAGLIYSGGRVFTDGGEVIDVSNPDSPTWEGSLPFQGRIDLRDPQSYLMMTTTGAFPIRTEIRIISTTTGSQMGSVAVPTAVTSALSTYAAKLIYAGGDSVALIGYNYAGFATTPGLAIIHDPTFGMAIRGTGGTGGTGGDVGTGGVGGAGGMGGAPDLCPGCTFATVPAYGAHMTFDPRRNLIYIAAHGAAPSHPGSIVTVDTATAAVTSMVPVGNDPQVLGLSDDGTALWVGLAGDHRVRRLAPAPTPVPGPTYPLPMLLTTGEQSVPYAVVVLPGAPSSIAVGVYGSTSGGRGVFILDDGQLRANYLQPPEVSAYHLTNGPPGFLIGAGDSYNLVMFRLGTVGATYESYGGLFSALNGLAYGNGFVYANAGEVVDLSDPDAPYPAGRFTFSPCALAIRSASRVMMLCETQDGSGPILRMLDNTTFTVVGSVTLPASMLNGAGSGADFFYVGGDAVAFMSPYQPLQIMHAPLIGAQP